MEYLSLNLKIISAKDLNNVNFFSKMDVYVVVSIVGDASSKQSTPVDRKGGKSPNWNFSMKFRIDAKAAYQGNLQLQFRIRCMKTLIGDRDLGEVFVPVKELLDSNSIGKGNPEIFLTYQVRKSSGKPKGELKFSYKFDEIKPVMTYPADVNTSSYYYQAPPSPFTGYTPAPYPPASPGYGYPPASPGGYRYPPASPGGYGYPPAAGGYWNRPGAQSYAYPQYG